MKLFAIVGFFIQAVFAFDVPSGEMTSGRARALVGVAFGLISLITGTIALLRSRGSLGVGNGRVGAIAALVLGLIAIVLSVIHLSIFTGGFGTGGGRAGAIVAIVLSLIGIALGGITLSRSRRPYNDFRPSPT
jgi:hypothetical protein